MTDQFELIARPASTIESPGVSAPKGLNRNRLSIVLSCLALLTAVSGAAVSGIRFYAAEQLKTLNEAVQLQLDARVNSVLEEYDKNPRSHPRLSIELAKLHSDLNYNPPAGVLSAYEDLAFAEFARRFATPKLERGKTAAEESLAVAAKHNQLQDTTKKRLETAEVVQRTLKEEVDAELAIGAVRPLIPVLGRAVMGAARGDRNLLGIPESSVIMPTVTHWSSQVEPVNPWRAMQPTQVGGWGAKESTAK